MFDTLFCISLLVLFSSLILVGVSLPDQQLNVLVLADSTLSL